MPLTPLARSADRSACTRMAWADRPASIRRRWRSCDTGALDALTRATVQDELLAAWRDTGLTVFMITHDVDEAIYLSDRVLLMTEGPRATLARDVRIPLPRPRDRASLLKDPRYYEVRASLVDFLHGRHNHENKGVHHGQERDESGGARGEEGQGAQLGRPGREGGAGRGVAGLVRAR